jgi:hypothetical protein
VLNLRLDELRLLLSRAEDACARQAGFADVADMDKRGGANPLATDDYYVCMAKYQTRTEPLQVIRKVLSYDDEKSLVGGFARRTLDQLWAIVAAYAKKRAKSAIKDAGKAPTYEDSAQTR